MTLKLLTNKWVLSGLAAILVLFLAASYQQGYKTAYQKQQAVIDKMEKDKAEALRLSAQNYARELEQAREEAKQSEAKAHAVGVALAITGCSSTTAPSATEIKIVEKAVMPTPPAALMVAPVRPNPPKDGKTATLLEHAAEFGGYVSELENQNAAWRDWVNSQAEVDGSEGAR